MAFSGRVRHLDRLPIGLARILGIAAVSYGLACKTQAPPPPTTAAAAAPEEAAVAEMVTFAASDKGPCLAPGKGIEDCPITGCATDDMPNKELLNTIKHTKPTGLLTVLTIDDFKWMQTEAQNRLGASYKPKVHFPPPDDEEDSGEEDSSLDQAARDQLHNLTVPSGSTVNEGDKVALVGFIVGEPRANKGGESVNCRLPNTDPNDFHVPLSESAQSTFGARFRTRATLTPRRRRRKRMPLRLRSRESSWS